MFGSTPSTGGSSISFGSSGANNLTFGSAQPAAPTASTLAPASSAPSAFNLTTAAPASSAASLAPAPNPLGQAPSTFVSSQPAASLSTTTTTTASANAPSAQMNFCQLEEHINKWTLALEEQEKMFMNQATQVNSWDKVLINNNNKIIALSEAVEKVKIDQQSLEQELEFIAAQHTELDECIAPLEQELAKAQHLDGEKAHTYVLAENLDTQLRQMSEDLKEVIEHLNEANKVQDTSDPIVQIGLILNAHMSSLQWIESSSAQVLAKIDDISGIYDTLRRDNERSIRLTYE